MDVFVPAGREVVTRERLAADLRALGLRAGGLVFFHSSLSSLGWVEGGADAVINALLDVVGAEGTVAVPSLCQRPASVEERFRLWDRAHTPSDVGRITETLRLRPDAHRSDHPTHAVAAVGRRALGLCRGHRGARPRPSPWGDTAFGAGSPWDRLRRWHASYLLLGVGWNVCTMLHYVQAHLQGEVLARLAPDPPWPPIDFRRMGAVLDASGSVHVGTVGQARCRWIDAADLVQVAVRAVLERLGDVLRLGPEDPYALWWAQARAAAGPSRRGAGAPGAE